MNTIRGGMMKGTMMVGLVVLAFATACGPGGESTAFVGNWTSVGSELTNCSGSVSSGPFNGAFTIGHGTAPDDVVTHSPDGCNLTWTTSGKSAGLKGPQTCSWPGVTATVQGGTLALNASDNGISFNSQGAVVINYQGYLYHCTFTDSATFTKTP